MSYREGSKMNLKLNNNRMEGPRRIVHLKKPESSIKEERQRTGRYIAILVGISLFLLAMYHAWVRRIPIVASLVVPALIMFVYVAWVLYTAARDKHRLLLLDAEAAHHAECMNHSETDIQPSGCQHNMDIAAIPGKHCTRLKSPDDFMNEATTYKEDCVIKTETGNRIMPIILINDKLPEDSDQKWTQIVATLANSERFKTYQTRRRYKRKFCRKKHAVFKRSYSIA